MSTLQEIILEALKHGVPVSLSYNKESEQIVYEVSGFAKSGNVRIEQVGDVIKVFARYNEVDTIEDFQDLARIAKYWHDSYKDRGYGLDGYWCNVFLEFGWIKKVVETKTTVAYV